MGAKGRRRARARLEGFFAFGVSFMRSASALAAADACAATTFSRISDCKMSSVSSLRNVPPRGQGANSSSSSSSMESMVTPSSCSAPEMPDTPAALSRRSLARLSFPSALCCLCSSTKTRCAIGSCSVTLCCRSPWNFSSSPSHVGEKFSSSMPALTSASRSYSGIGVRSSEPPSSPSAIAARALCFASHTASGEPSGGSMNSPSVCFHRFSSYTYSHPSSPKT